MQPLDWKKIGNLKEKQEQHLSAAQQQQWNEWVQMVQESEELVKGEAVEFDSSILTRFEGKPYNVPDLEHTKAQTLKLIEGAQIRTSALQRLEAEDMLSAWKPFFEPVEEEVKEVPVRESPLDSTRRKMKRPYEMMTSVEDIMQAAAPPGDKQLQEEPTRMPNV